MYISIFDLLFGVKKKCSRSYTLNCYPVVVFHV